MLNLASLEQLKKSVLQLGPRRLAVLGLMLFASIAVVLGGSYFVSRPDFEAVYVGLTPTDATRIATVLNDQGLTFDISVDNTRLSARRGEAARVRAVLSERGLPTSPNSGYELFDKLGPLGLTTFMQEVTRVRALEGEIARTIQILKGVRSARVHIALGEQGSYRRQTQAPSASVVIRTEAAGDRSKSDAIRHLVSAAIPGLKAADVRVLSADGQVLSGGGDEGFATSNRLVALEKEVAQEIQNNINRTLVPHLGLENFEVSVAVRLNIDKRQTTETTYDPNSKVERSVRMVKESGNAQNSGGRNAVSVEQAIPGEQANASGSDQSRKTNQKREELTNYEVGSRMSAVNSDGYRIEKISIAAILNRKRLSEVSGAAATPEATTRQVSEIQNSDRFGCGCRSETRRRGDGGIRRIRCRWEASRRNGVESRSCGTSRGAFEHPRESCCPDRGCDHFGALWLAACHKITTGAAQACG